MISQDCVASARLRYLTTSAQKTRLVVDLIRGKNVAEALVTLRYTRKAVAEDIGRMLDSALSNARQKKQDVDVDRLYVHTAFVDGGPTLKRVRPAPMGRAYRVLKRMCHVTIGLGERPVHMPSAPHAAGPAGGRTAGPARGQKAKKVARAGAVDHKRSVGSRGRSAASATRAPAKKKKSKKRS